MRRAAIRQLSNNVLVSLNRFLYVMQGQLSNSLADKQHKFDKLTVSNTVEMQAQVHYEVFEKEDVIVLTDESNKQVNFYKLSDFLSISNGQLPDSKSTIYTRTHFKKVVDMKSIAFNLAGNSISGLLIADKTGEIGFINIDKLIKNQQANQEETKNEDEDQDLVCKTLFGHQESCLAFQITPDNKYIVSCDTLKKIVVSNFPNVFNTQSVCLEHKNDINFLSLLDNEKVASYSKQDERLVVSALEDGSLSETHTLDSVENMTNSQITKRPCIIRKAQDSKLTVEILPLPVTGQTKSNDVVCELHSDLQHFMTEDGYLIKADYDTEKGGLRSDFLELMLL